MALIKNLASFEYPGFKTVLLFPVTVNKVIPDSQPAPVLTS